MERLKNNPKWGFSEEQPEGHAIHTTNSLIVRDELITKLKPKKTILTNLSNEIDYNEIKKKLPKNVIPAHDGLTVLI